MAAAAEKKPALGLLLGIGKDKPMPSSSEPDGDEGMPPPDDKGGDEPSEAYKTAIQETGLPLDDEQMSALWRAIKECSGSY